ncbi:MAG TPA: hypothetical protein VMY76_07100, partial [Gemmatimonadales bacterium]|nr:hypothetical protein [Gemmatimonadales bacterium]
MRTLQQGMASLIILGAAFTGGARSGPTHPAADPPVVTVEANDFALAVPATVPAGVVTFRLVNHGKEAHHAQLVRLENG